MTELAELYLQLGSAGFIALLFGFMIYNLIQEAYDNQSESLAVFEEDYCDIEEGVEQLRKDGYTVEKTFLNGEYVVYKISGW